MKAYRLKIWVEGDVNIQEYYTTKTKCYKRIEQLEKDTGAEIEQYFGGNGYDIDEIKIK